MKAEPDEEQNKAKDPAAQQDLGDNFEPFGGLCGHVWASIIGNSFVCRTRPLGLLQFGVGDLCAGEVGVVEFLQVGMPLEVLQPWAGEFDANSLFPVMPLDCGSLHHNYDLIQNRYEIW